MFTLRSKVFEDRKFMPAKYAAGGVAGAENLSPPLEWEDAPSGTQSFALASVDRHPIARNWVHWLIVDIPADVRELAEGVSRKSIPEGSIELQNTAGMVGYGGPMPPVGSGPHDYEFTIYALGSASLELREKDNFADFERALEGKVLGSAKLTGIFER